MASIATSVALDHSEQHVAYVHPRHLHARQVELDELELADLQPQAGAHAACAGDFFGPRVM
jgi:hypothetical protein